MYGLRKKGDRGLELRIFGLQGGHGGGGRRGRIPLVAGVLPAKPPDGKRNLGVSPGRLDLRIVADHAAAAGKLPAPLVDGHVGAGRVPRPPIVVALVAAAQAACEDLIALGMVPASRRLGGARAAITAPRTRRPATAGLRARPPQRKRGRQLERIEVVPRRAFEHEKPVRAALPLGLFQTLTHVSCLRISPSQARKVFRFRREEEGVQTRSDGSQAIAEGQTGLIGAGFSPPAAVAGGSAALEDLARAVDRDLATPDLAPATERAYAHDWADFSAFCERHGLEALPAVPQTLALYLKTLETRRSQSLARRAAVLGGNAPPGLALPTLRRRLAAIATRHASAGLETPTDHALVRKMLRRYARSRGTAVQKKDPLLIERLPALLLAMPEDLPALRDRALLLLGYAGAFRRSELVSLDVEDLRFSAAGLYVWIRAAKNDPRKKGRELYVPRLPKTELCAVAALEAWLDVVGATGPLFRTFDLRGRLTSTRLDPGDVARILRRRCAAAGVAGDFAGHSLRRGFITNAAKKKVPIESIKSVTGQRSSGIVLDYVAAATLDEDPPLLEIVGIMQNIQL